MSDLGNLLQMIYDLLTGWFNSFTDHATALMEKLNLIEEDTASIKNSTSDIKSNTDDIKDNTGAIVTPVQSIKTNTGSIKTDTTSIKNNVSTMTNQLGTISTNVGTASAFTEDVANNTLDIKDRIVTIGSDTTQLRSNSNTITSDVSDIKTALNYYLANTPVTEDVEGAVCNIDTDLSDYLQLCKVTIPADQTGYTSITLTKCGKNFYPFISPDTKNGITLTNDNGIITINGTATADAYFDIDNLKIPLPSGLKLYLCAFNPVGAETRLSLFLITDNIGNPQVNMNNSNAILETTINADAIVTRLRLRVPNGATYSNFKLSPYLQIGGSTPTEFEPYKSITYPISFGTTITDGAEINLLDGIIKVNSTPVSYLSITPIAVRTYKGINNIYSDIGTTALTYRETLKHYIDKQEA